ncbi:MAG: metallophosphoesterase [Vicinamibacterales bacterium]
MTHRSIGPASGLAIIVLLGLLGLLAAPSSPRLAAADSPCAIENVDRIVAIGDVHGAYQRLVDILRATGLIDAQLRWSGQAAHLVQLGDVVDRGPDSRQALDLLRRLEAEAALAGGAVHLLLGNHEVMLMADDMRFVHPGEYRAFQSPDSEAMRRDFVRRAAPALRSDLLNQMPLGYVEMRRAFDRQGVYGQWLGQHNVMTKINGLLFVHGGIPPALAGLACDTVNATIRREITTDLEKALADPRANLSGVGREDDGHLWNRQLAEEPDSFAPQVNDILAKQNARAIVIAHTVTGDRRIRVRFGGRVFQIDTGMQPDYVPTGRAAALNIERGVFTAIYLDRRDVLQAAPTAVPTAPRAPVPR